MTDWLTEYPRLSRVLRVFWQPARDCRLERVQAAVADAIHEIGDLREILHRKHPSDVLELVNKLDDVA